MSQEQESLQNNKLHQSEREENYELVAGIQATSCSVGWQDGSSAVMYGKGFR
jgi:hypothetical protein